MNATAKLMACFTLVAFLTHPLCADVFQNLDFEDAVIDPSLALPYWELNESVEYFVYNGACLGSICTSIHDDGTNVKIFQPLEGTYSILLQAGTGAGQVNSIWQSGTVPANTANLTLLAILFAEPDSFQVTFDGTPLTLLSDFNDGNPREVYDISSFAGATGVLEISVTTFFDNFEAAAFIDDVQFAQVPESSSALLVLICLASIFRRKR